MRSHWTENLRRKKKVKVRLKESVQNATEWTKRKDRYNAVYYRGYADALEWVLEKRDAS